MLVMLQSSTATLRAPCFHALQVKNLRQVMDIVDTTKDESCDCNEPHWIQQAFVFLRELVQTYARSSSNHEPEAMH